MKILRRFFYVLVFLLTFIYIGIIYAPINLFKSKIYSALPPQINLVGLDGTLGSGTIDSIVFNGVSFSNVSWKLNPFLMKVNVLIPAKSDWRLVAGLGFGGFKLNVKTGSLDFVSIPMASLDGEFKGSLIYKASFNLECRSASGKVSADKIALSSPIQTSVENLNLKLSCKDSKTLLLASLADKNLVANAQALLNKQEMDLKVSGKLGGHDLTPLLETIVYPNENGEFSLNQKLLF